MLMTQNALPTISLHQQIHNANLYQDDCLNVLKELETSSIDSIVTDPPYGISFMAKKWDYDVPSEAIWRECLRVLKPGGHLLCFAGTRTHHRMAARIEDAGFEIRDMIAWVYGSGFPKSHNLQNDWQGWGTALKPALEPITMARKLLEGTVAENVLMHGVGAINIDKCRVEHVTVADGNLSLNPHLRLQINGGNGGNIISHEHDRRVMIPHIAGRWPANLIHDGSEEVLAGFPVTGPSPKQYTKKKAGWLTPGSEHQESDLQSREYGDTGSAARFFQQCKGDYNEEWQDQNLTRSSADTAEQSSSLQNLLAATVQKAAAIWPNLAGILSSEQTAAFTPVTLNESKAISETVMQTMASIASGFLQESQHERRTPCGSLVRTAATQKPTGITTITTSLCRSDGSVEAATFIITQTSLDLGGQVSRFNYCAKASKQDRENDNNHPTVKPTDLMRYLCRLVTPPNGLVLDPFMGSGSTGKAAMMEGFQFIGIEREAEYFDIACARIERASQGQSALW